MLTERQVSDFLEMVGNFDASKIIDLIVLQRNDLKLILSEFSGEIKEIEKYKSLNQFQTCPGAKLMGEKLNEVIEFINTSMEK